MQGKIGKMRIAGDADPALSMDSVGAIHESPYGPDRLPMLVD
jgi:hypothetical protein